MTSTQTYWLQRGDGPYREVTLEEWCSAERSAGFYSKGGHGHPATGGFGSSGSGVKGSMLYRDPTPEMVEQYATWNPELAEALTAKYFPMYKLVDGFLCIVPKTLSAVGQMEIHRAGPNGYKRAAPGTELLRNVVWWHRDEPYPDGKFPNGNVWSNLMQEILADLPEGSKIRLTLEVVE